MKKIEDALVDYINSYDQEKAASAAFAKAFCQCVDSATKKEEEMLKKDGKMLEHGSLHEEKYKQILAEIKEEAFGNNKHLWDERSRARRVLGASKRTLVHVAKRVREEQRTKGSGDI